MPRTVLGINTTAIVCLSFDLAGCELAGKLVTKPTVNKSKSP